MTSSTVLDIIKKALLLEKRGKAFYTKVAEQSTNKGVKELFTLMALEEENHIKILSDQYKSYSATQTFTLESIKDSDHSHIAAIVLTEEIKKEISAADFEAAAISAAMEMEKSAIAQYLKRSQNSTNENEKSMYSWLAQWEQSHLDYLIDLDKEIVENIWYDNQFWPF